MKLGGQQAVHRLDRDHILDPAGQIGLEGNRRLRARAQGRHGDRCAFARFGVRHDQGDARQQEGVQFDRVVIGPFDGRVGQALEAADAVDLDATFRGGLGRGRGSRRGGGRRGGGDGFRRSRRIEARNARLVDVEIDLLKVARQVGDGGQQNGFIVGALGHLLDTRAQGLTLRLVKHGRRAEQQAAHQRQFLFLLLQGLAHETCPDLGWLGFLAGGDLLKALFHRLAGGGEGFRRGFKCGGTVAIGGRHEMGSHERRGAQGAIEHQGCVCRERQTALATAIHRARFRLLHVTSSGSCLIRPRSHPGQSPFVCRESR